MNGILWLALAAGAAAALPKKQQHNQMKLPSFRGVAEVRASLPGRIRLYMPAVSQQPELAAQMKAQLEGTGAVHQVTMQPLTGSVLILYDESQVQAPVVLGAAILAGCGVGIYPSIEEGVRQTVKWDREFQPQAENAPVYAALYENWRKVYAAQLALCDEKLTRNMWIAPGL